MAKDVIITPADGDIQFENSTGTEAGKIEQSGDDLVLSNAVGDILIGDGTTDVYIGDGAANVDIVFEQNGSIRGEAGSSVDITLGSSDTDIIISGSTFNIDPDASFTGLINANNKLTFTTSNGYVLFDHQPQTGVGEYTSEVPLLRIDYDGSEKTILSRTTGGGAITIGADDSVVIAAGDTKAVIKTNLNLGAENVIFSSETGFHAYGFPNNSTVWSNRQEFRFYTGGTDTSLNGLWIGDGSNTQFIDLSRNLKNIGTISSGAITTSGMLTLNAGGSLIRKVVSTWTNATTHDILYQGWNTNTDDYIYLKTPGNSTTNHGTAFISDNVIALGRTDVETGAPELSSSTAPIDENWFVLNSTTATFSGTITATNFSGTSSGTNTGDQDLSGYSITSHNHDGRYLRTHTRYSDDLDTITTSGVYIWDVSEADDEPTGASDGLLTIKYWDSTNWATANFQDFHANKLYIKSKQSNTWQTDWARVWTTDQLSDTVKGQYDTAYTYSQVGHLPLAGGTLTGNLTVDIADGGSSPAMTSTFRLKGYGGRGAGIKIQDSVNSTSGPSDREWFIGSGYGNSGFNIGYASDGVQSSYTAQSFFNIATSGNATFSGTITATNFSGTSSGTNTGDQDLSGYSLTSHNHDDRYYTETEINENLASLQGWVPAYSNTEGSSVRWNFTEDALQIQLDTDTTTGASFKARRIISGERIRVTIMAKASAAASTGVYFRLYQHNGDMPDGKTHVSNDASNSSVLVQEDDASVTSWHENGAITTDWVTYEKEYTAIADGYISLVILNWTNLGTNSLYIKNPDIQTIKAATVTTNANLTGGVTSVGNAATVVTNANLTGHVTSTGNATILGSFTTAQLNAAISDGTIPTDHGDHAGLYLPIGGGILTGDLTVDNNTPRIDFKSDQSGGNVGGRIELNENGNLWVNAQGGKDLWLNWYSPNSQSSKADLAVGDGDSGAAILFVDGSERKVGINKTNPTQALDVNGSIAVEGETVIGSSTGFLDIGQSTATATSKGLKFHSDETLAMTIDTEANVGIGTTSPSSKLEVYASGSTVLDIQGSQGQLFSITDDLTGDLFTVSDISGVPVFNVNASGTSYFDDKVGIGTTSPTSLLEISQQLSAAATIDYPLVISSKDDGNSTNQLGEEGVGIKFRIAGNDSGTPGDSLVGASIAAIRESASDTDSSTGLGFFITQNDETLDEALRIDHDGKVGIGTTSPAALFHTATPATESAAVNNELRIQSTHSSGYGGKAIVNLLTSQYGLSGIYMGDNTTFSSQPSSIEYVDSSDMLKYKAPQNHTMLVGTATKMSINTATTYFSGNNVGIGTTSPSHQLEVGLESTVALANQPAIPLMVSNDGNNVDGRVFIQVKHDIVSTAGAIAAGFQMTAAAVSSGTPSYFSSLMFLESAQNGSDTIHSAPKAIKFYVDNHGTAAGVGTSYGQLGDFAMIIAESTDVGIGDDTPSYKLDVAGTIRATGDVLAFSDRRVKENIKTIENASDKLLKLRGVEYNKIGETKKSIGVIAQEIEEVLPEVVSTDTNGMKSVAYGNITGVLIEAIKELKAEIEELKKQIK